MHDQGADLCTPNVECVLGCVPQINLIFLRFAEWQHFSRFNTHYYCLFAVEIVTKATISLSSNIEIVLFCLFVCLFVCLRLRIDQMVYKQP